MKQNAGKKKSIQGKSGKLRPSVHRWMHSTNTLAGTNKKATTKRGKIRKLLKQRCIRRKRREKREKREKKSGSRNWQKQQLISTSLLCGRSGHRILLCASRRSCGGCSGSSFLLLLCLGSVRCACRRQACPTTRERKSTKERNFPRTTR